MDKVKVEIENCYGINKLECEFDFTKTKNTNTTQAIYAPNGVMKTSLANVFDDFSKDKESKDLIHPDKVSVRKIIDQDGEELNRDSVFVIRPYQKEYKSEKISSLLVNEELRKEYDEIHENINAEKMKLFNVLRDFSGLKSGIEEEVSCAITGDINNFFIALERLKPEVHNDNTPLYSNIVYGKIFDDKVVNFLESGDIKVQIKSYIEKYDELLAASTYLKKGFDHYNASTVHKNLKSNGFFTAEHTINLNNDGDRKEISSESELEEIIQKEKDEILNDADLKSIFEKIDKKISNAQLREFRRYLFENKEILKELSRLDSFKQKLWIAYLKEHKDLFDNLLLEYNKGKEKIEGIIRQAKAEETEWEKVIEIFNRRFHVPYKLKIKNKEDTILRNETPSIHYNFEDKDDVGEELLLEVLSRGEKRAFYLLNIIFEIESRKRQGIKSLFIIDDIADSFDYKNKYAIIEYLKEISDDENIFSVILTHNFDFFRTVQDRLGMNSFSNSYMAIKGEEEISLKKLDYKYIKNPLASWKNDLDNDAKLVASITFARNIAEYTGDTANMSKLTSLLHIKQDTSNITINNIQAIYRDIFKDKQDLVLNAGEVKVFDLIFETAEKICQTEFEQGVNLENKIVISIAIRLTAEIYMIDKINDNDFVEEIKSGQTGKLFKRFKKKFPSEYDAIEILEKVSIMTPENIHLNSFMYEPILDISDYHLKQLYVEIKALNSNKVYEQDEIAATQV